MTFDQATSPSNSSAANASGLIVDFPYQRSTNQPISARSVRFSTTSQMVVFPRSSSRENKIKWHCEQDYKYFKLQRYQDSVYCSNLMMYKKNRGESFTADDADKFTGLEFLMSSDIPKRARQIVDERQAHTNLVLSGQEYLRQANINDANALARLSAKSSRQARTRSQKMAAASASSFA